MSRALRLVAGAVALSLLLALSSSIGACDIGTESHTGLGSSGNPQYCHNVGSGVGTYYYYCGQSAATGGLDVSLDPWENCQYCHGTIQSNVSASVHRDVGCRCHAVYHDQHGYWKCWGGGCHFDITTPADIDINDWMTWYVPNVTAPFTTPPNASVLVEKNAVYSDLGPAGRGVYIAWVDALTGDPGPIDPAVRYVSCFNCHFMTVNPAAASPMTLGNTRGIPLPREVLTLIKDWHSIKPLSEYELAGSDGATQPPWVATVVAVTSLLAALLILRKAGRAGH